MAELRRSFRKMRPSPSREKIVRRYWLDHPENHRVGTDRRSQLATQLQSKTTTRRDRRRNSQSVAQCKPLAPRDTGAKSSRD